MKFAFTFLVASAVVGQAFSQTFGSSSIDRTVVDFAGQITFIDTQNLCPTSGKITSWSLFAKGTGDIVLQIWRPLGGSSYKLIGANSTNVTALGVNTISVAGGDQIDALAGDLLGFRYNQTTFDTRIVGFEFGGGGFVYTAWPDASTDVPVGGTLSVNQGQSEFRTYSINATVQAVPEPTTVMALAAGMMLLGRRRR